MPSLVKSCTCKHEYQDQLYGKQQRVFNLGGGKNQNKATCTACGKVTGQ